MKLEKLPLKDMFLIQRPVFNDERGRFSRLFDDDDFLNAGLNLKAVNINSSTSIKKGTLRGIHFQYPPFSETKIVCCTSGSIWDLGVDLRPKSPTRFDWFGIELNPENGKSLLIPDGFGHAFITLESNTTVVYVTTEQYSQKHESGIIFNDPLLKINWPIEPKTLSEKDKNWGNLDMRIEELNKGFNGLYKEGLET